MTNEMKFPTSLRGSETRMFSAAVLTGLLVVFLTFLQVPTFAQVVTASLSGTVTDTSGAVVPGAKVVLTNEATNVPQTTTSNASGDFTFPALEPGTYTLSISSTGFATWEAKGITLNQNESRTVPKITLQVRTATQKVTVVSRALAMVPLNTGASSATLNNRMVSQLAIQGRDAMELVRLMPGMAMNSGLSQSQWNSRTTQNNSGPIGQFSASGTQPYGGMQAVSDGSVIVDSGNQGTQIANVNQDMTQEVTIKNSAFDAQYAHGPVTFNAVGKSGTAQFHGGVYAYMRNGSANSEDSYLKASGLKKPIDHYWYPGFNLGGPVLLPFTNFNKNHDKAFFFVGYENMRQSPSGTLHKYIVPNAQMLQGNFSPSVLAPFSGLGSGIIPCTDTGAWNYGNFCSDAVNNGQIVNGQVVDQSLIDPNGLALLKTMPSPNVDPTATGGYNYEFLDGPPVNRQEIRVRGDVNITQNMRAFVSFTRQPETDINNIGVWWWPSGSVPYPSQLPANQVSRMWSFGVTNIITPSMTNQATFGYAYFINPVSLANPSAVDPSNVGYSVTPHFDQIVPQIPNIVSWGYCCTGNNGQVPGYDAPAFGSKWQAGGQFGKDAKTPDVSDNFTWIKGKHTMKAGFFWASYANIQTEGYGSGPNGWLDFDNWAFNASGNDLFDMLIGHPVNYAQTNGIFVDNTLYHEIAFYGQDSWKLTPRFTLNYGVRFDHEGQWYPGTGNKGLMAWDPSTYDASASGLTGFVWHSMDSSVPMSAFASKSFYPDVRVGAAYDLFGNGKTVLRGGFGVYRFQLAYNSITANGMLSAPLGTVNYTSNCTVTQLVDLEQCGAAAAAARNTQTYGGALLGDNMVPYTQSWDVIVDQRAPWNSTFEVEYQGNRSRDLLISANGGGGVGLADINLLPYGSLFQPDPVTGITYYCQGTPSATCVTSGPPSDAIPHYRPYDYSAVDIIRHASYSNYNALVLAWMKQAGPFVFNLNYTWSHALGIRDGNNDNGQGAGASLNSFNLASNYGTLAFNRAQLFNASYVINLPSPIHGNPFLKGVVNGWQISGVTQYQSGPPIQTLTGGSLNSTYGTGVGNQAILGTDGMTLVPYLTCNPGANLKSGQYFNSSCFQNPGTRGVNGPIIWPNITGPSFFDSDLGFYKTFKITERQGLQFRVTAFNFLNHPLEQLGLGTDINLNFADSNGNPIATNQNANTNGGAMYTTGNRELEFAIKYTF